MDSCHICQSTIPLGNEGIMVISIDDAILRNELMKKIEEIGIGHRLIEQKIHINYISWPQLQQCTTVIEELLSKEQLEICKGTLKADAQSKSLRNQSQEYTLSQLMLIINNPRFVKIIQEQMFQSFMQPIISTSDQQLFGYEFLLRSKEEEYPFFPSDLFAFSKEAGLQSVLDSQARINAVKTGSENLPNGVKRFINFLPSSIYDPQHCLNTTFEAVKYYDVNPHDLVFEVVETEKIRDLSQLKNIFYHYQKAGMEVALDDIGTGYSTIEVLKELKPDYAKIDRELIQNCHQNSTKLHKIKQIRKCALEIGTTLLAEGIETIEELRAVEPFVDLAQGYYFGKPLKNPL